MTPLTQPTPTTCGQTCVAMVTGVSVDDVIAIIGSRKTYPRDLIAAFDHFGWTMQSRNIAKLPKVPDGKVAVVFSQFVINHKLYGHWIAWDGCEFLDPATGNRSRIIPSGVSGRFYEVERP